MSITGIFKYVDVLNSGITFNDLIENIDSSFVIC